MSDTRKITFPKPPGKYRKKPVVIEAEQYTLATGIESPFLKEAVCTSAHDGVYGGPHIHTLEGLHDVNEGDYVIKGVKGEFYPCKPDIFKLTYEKVL